MSLPAIFALEAPSRTAAAAQPEVPGLAPQAGAQEPRDIPLCGVCRSPVPPKRTRGGKPKKWCSPECGRIAWERKHPGRRGWQAAFPGESRVERAFHEWIQSPDGHRVEAEVVARARRLKALGSKRYGIAALVESIRYDWTVKLVGGEYRINNSHRSLLARKVMARCPDLAGFFETRMLRGAA